MLVKELVQSSSFRVPYLTSLAYETEKIAMLRSCDYDKNWPRWYIESWLPHRTYSINATFS